ncbi:hypothetical protein BMS3Abin13_00958 [bacterium BMS3Abin13]|nr:hypothetical protein BMS3Abin13_00958 [bacterium BMS3Abin13]
MLPGDKKHPEPYRRITDFKFCLIQSGEVVKNLCDTFLVLLRVVDNEKRAGSFEIKRLRFIQVDKTGRPIMTNLHMVGKFSSQPAFANPALPGDKLNGNGALLQGPLFKPNHLIIAPSEIGRSGMPAKQGKWIEIFALQLMPGDLQLAGIVEGSV